MLEFRRAKVDELEGIAEFVIEGMHAEKYPLIVAPSKIRHLIRHLCFSSTDFHLCAFNGKDLVGVIAALVVESPLFERCDAHVVACRAVHPGCGHRLLSDLRTWRQADPRIVRTLWSMEPDADPRIKRLARWYGFKSSNEVLLAYRGN